MVLIWQHYCCEGQHAVFSNTGLTALKESQEVLAFKLILCWDEIEIEVLCSMVRSIKRRAGLWAEQAAVLWNMGKKLVLLDLPQDLPCCHLGPA